MKTMIRTLHAMLPLLAALTLPLLVMCGDDGDEIPGPEVPYCQKACAAVDECCAKPPCDKGAGAEACLSGLCKFVGCSTEADCPNPFGSAIQLTMKCEKVKYEGRTVGVCVPTCATDTDCPKIPFINVQMACKQVTQYNYSTNTCVLPCKTDQDCSAYGLKCKDASYCDASAAAKPECKSDADCANNPGEKKCDVERGLCFCESDQACTDGYKASYKCLK